MAINKTQRGFALYVAVIFMSVMLTLGLALASLGYKQQILASGAIRSQDAFYVADTALECILYADQQQGAFDYSMHDASTHPTPPTCDTVQTTEVAGSYSYTTGDTGRLLVKYQASLDGGTHCANVMVSKPNPATLGGVTYLFSQGYDVPCGDVGGVGRFASRGLSAHY